LGESKVNEKEGTERSRSNLKYATKICAAKRRMRTPSKNQEEGEGKEYRVPEAKKVGTTKRRVQCKKGFLTLSVTLEIKNQGGQVGQKVTRNLHLREEEGQGTSVSLG